MAVDWSGMEVWCTSVFTSPIALGNPTGVVFSNTPPDPTEAVRLAALLGFPDTAFLSPTPHGEWKVDTYSPAEAISFCVQTLLACQVVLSNRFSLTTNRDFVVGEHQFEATHDHDHKSRVWISLGNLPPRVISQKSSLGRLLDSSWPEGHDTVVECGRRRIYRELTQNELYSARLNPADILEFCAQERLHGICLFSQSGPREYSLRVYTTSLDGAEDSATGGAVAGLVHCLKESHGQELTDEHLITVNQGRGPRSQRGTLYARAGDVISVGGDVTPLFRGYLFGVTEQG